MANNNGKITAPISLTGDIYQVLGLSGNDVGYACANSHKRINKWSRYKPVRFNSVMSPTDAQLKLLYFGIDVPKDKTQGNNVYIKNVALVIMGSLGSTATYPNYEYLPPRGAANGNHENEFYRMTDFEGYYSNAEVPFTCNMLNDKDEINSFDAGTSTIRIGFTNTANAQFTAGEMLNVGDNMVFTVEVYKNDQSFATTGSTPFLWVAYPKDLWKTIAGDGVQIALPISEIRTAYKAKYGTELTAGVRLEFIFGLNKLKNNSKITANASNNHFSLVSTDVEPSYALVVPWGNDKDQAKKYREFYRSLLITAYFNLQVAPNQIWVWTSQSNFVGVSGTSNETLAISPNFGVTVNITNPTGSTTTYRLRSHPDSQNKYQTGDMIFRAQAHGSGYTDNSTSNDQAYNTYGEGKMIDCEVRETINNTNSANMVTIAPGATKTIGLYMENGLPIGLTTGVAVYASTDNGGSWVIVSSFAANVRRNP